MVAGKVGGEEMLNIVFIELYIVQSPGLGAIDRSCRRRLKLVVVGTGSYARQVALLGGACKCAVGHSAMTASVSRGLPDDICGV